MKVGFTGQWALTLLISIVSPYSTTCCPLLKKFDVQNNTITVSARMRRRAYVLTPRGHINSVAIANLGEVVGGLAVHLAEKRVQKQQSTSGEESGRVVIHTQLATLHMSYVVQEGSKSSNAVRAFADSPHAGRFDQHPWFVGHAWATQDSLVASCAVPHILQDIDAESRRTGGGTVATKCQIRWKNHVIAIVDASWKVRRVVYPPEPKSPLAAGWGVLVGKLTEGYIAICDAIMGKSDPKDSTGVDAVESSKRLGVAGHPLKFMAGRLEAANKWCFATYERHVGSWLPSGDKEVETTETTRPLSVLPGHEKLFGLVTASAKQHFTEKEAQDDSSEKDKGA